MFFSETHKDRVENLTHFFLVLSCETQYTMSKKSAKSQKKRKAESDEEDDGVEMTDPDSAIPSSSSTVSEPPLKKAKVEPLYPPSEDAQLKTCAKAPNEGCRFWYAVRNGKFVFLKWQDTPKEDFQGKTAKMDDRIAILETEVADLTAKINGLSEKIEALEKKKQ